MLFCGALAASLFLIADSIADKIVLKDGSAELSERVWETEHYVHFILKGTNDVEIRYAKEIVARIERTQPAGETAAPMSWVPVETPKIISGSANANKSPPEPVAAAGRGAATVVSQQTLETHQRLVQNNNGLNFYDPRRPKRYWAMRDSKHSLLASAIRAIANPYGRSVKWVEDHMGQENDLGKIHRNLARQFFKEALQAGEPDGLENDGQPDAAPPVEDVKESKHTPAAEDAVEPIHSIKTVASPVPPVRPQDNAGIRFYDPRRSERYWSGKMTRHHTLKEALKALSQQYGVTPSWIERHMGETNDLSIIHRNIQENLKQE